MTSHGVKLRVKRLRAAAKRSRSRSKLQTFGLAPLCLAAVVAALATISMHASPVRAQSAATTRPISTIDCPNPESQDLVMPPDLVRSSDGILKGTINLSDERQRMPTSVAGKVTCRPQTVRVFRGEGLPPAPPAQKPDPWHGDPIPGPTLRARVGDRVQLTFINQVDANRFNNPILDVDKCQRVGQDGQYYPGTFDKPPNCLHASSTANIHFHGTHTNPNSTGDNVYLQIRPLPRDKPLQPDNRLTLTTTPAEASVSLDEFFKTCMEQLENPLNSWPVTWSDLPERWVKKQTELLQAFQAANPDQPLWTKDEKVLNAGGWPQYYIGAFPFCFALPAYTALVWPPPPGSTSPNMGQSPGTHWYHAHKHGSTAINVANGMTGAFIIEGEYDDDLNANYGAYVLKDNKPWNTRLQPVLVLNQLATQLDLLRGGGSGFRPGVDFVVNGRLRPKVQMQPGEVQLWRIVNTSGRSAVYFMAPEGLKWRQLAQDGVQFANVNYLDSQNKPFYMAPGNRVDLLVQAPLEKMSAEIRVQNVLGRSVVSAEANSESERVLMLVNVSGDPVMRGGEAAQMLFLAQAPKQPVFLKEDISDKELSSNNGAKTGAKTLVFNFNSKARKSPMQHTINDIQFMNGEASLVNVTLGAVEEWTVKNTTSTKDEGPGVIDHPFHIHINPFQVTEVFDPNEKLVNEQTGKLEAVGGQAVPRYVTDKAQRKDRQCFLDPKNTDTWSVTGACGPQRRRSNLVWYDVFAIPSARVPTGANNKPLTDPKGEPIVIPGYFKMRSRFVDYPGLYVMHCHILIHEDRGMMFSVEVIKPGAPAKPILLHH